MSRRRIGYPTGWTLAVLDEGVSAVEVVADLRSEGVPSEDIVALSGADAADGLDRLGTSTGIGACDAASSS